MAGSPSPLGFSPILERNFPMNHYACLLVGWMIGRLIVGLSKFPSKKRKLHFCCPIGALVYANIGLLYILA